jgi:predicted kinase
MEDDQKTLPHLLIEMVHYDKDNRWMAAQDICTLVLEQEANSLQKSEGSIIDAYLVQLEDKHTEV